MSEVNNYIFESLRYSLTTSELHLENIELTDERLNLISTAIQETGAPNSITLKNCKLRQIPDFLNLCPNLMILNLTDNFIRQIKISSSTNSKLVILNLSGNPLSKLDNIHCAESLRILLLNNTNILSIPENWRRLSIRVLELSNHKLKNPEHDIRNLPTTTYKLLLKNGTCKNWKLSVGHLENLENLDVSGNAITEIDRNIKFCENLKVLDLSNNHLHKLPSELYQLPSLKQFDCSKNPLGGKIKVSTR